MPQNAFSKWKYSCLWAELRPVDRKAHERYLGNVLGGPLAESFQPTAPDRDLSG